MSASRTVSELRAERLREFVWLASPLFGDGFAKPIVLPDGIVMDQPGSNYAGYLTFRDQFGAGLDARFHTIEWLDEQVHFGGLRTIATTGAALLFEIRDYPTGATELHVVDAVGNLETANAVLRPAIENYAREIGCTFTKINSLAEWVKPLTSDGYAQQRVPLRKEL